MNTNAKLRELIHAEDFVPFEIELANGRKLLVPHPDFISVPAERFDRHQPYFTVYKANGAGTAINPLLVLRLTPHSRPVRR